MTNPADEAGERIMAFLAKCGNADIEAGVEWLLGMGSDADGWAFREGLRTAISGATHRHKKRGSEYVLIGFGKMQAGEWFDGAAGCEERAVTTVDMREVAIYRSVDNGSLWVRPREEFEGGRLEELQPFPRTTP